ncbi:MAG: M28 family peptidase [Bacteroidaceae bacterium]|nr:M28 family peptidase [Bacteroidaceae bacterium]
MKKYILLMAAAIALVACKNGKQATATSDVDTIAISKCPVFVADSAMKSIVEQCAFGPRVTGTKEHVQCGDYIVNRFKQYGCEVIEQTMELQDYDGKKIPCRNIIASINPEKADRVLFCAHWDSRPWADHDPDEANHHTPVLAANDGASGVAVMLEMARLIQQQPLSFGVDFICFDAEDRGVPDWETDPQYTEMNDTWCLGSVYWAKNPHKENYAARYGVLFDMVGGRGSKFSMEGVSRYYADTVVQMLWHLAEQIGYGSYFPIKNGGTIQDDHVAVNQIAGIPCIDIIPYFEQGPSSFGPTWHTVSDTPENIDPAVLKAVGQSVLQMLYNDK